MVINKYLAEAVGTFILVLIGSMSILAAQTMGAPILVVVPFGFGLGLMAAIYAVGHVSGGHFNPAVTLAMWMDKRMKATDVPGYLIAQFAGGILASSVVLLMSDQAAVAGTATSFGANGAGVGFMAEFALTLIFVLVILSSTKTAPAVAGVVISLTLAAVHFAGIPFSGASVNPARSFGPAVVGGTVSELWVYLVAPMAGGAIGWVLWRMFGGNETE